MTMTMTQCFTNASANAVKEMLSAHLETLQAEDFDVGNIALSGTPQELTFTIKVIPKGAKSSEQVLLESYAKMHGLDLNKTGHLGGVGHCKLVAYKPRNTKMPWIVENDKGKRYKLTTETALLQFKAD